MRSWPKTRISGRGLWYAQHKSLDMDHLPVASAPPVPCSLPSCSPWCGRWGQPVTKTATTSLTCSSVSWCRVKVKKPLRPWGRLSAPYRQRALSTTTFLRYTYIALHLVSQVDNGIHWLTLSFQQKGRGKWTSWLELIKDKSVDPHAKRLSDIIVPTMDTAR